MGGGPAGAAAAIALAGGGMRPTILERSRETPDALCGGFLSWRSLAALDALGIAADSLNPARIRHLRLFAGGRMAQAALPAPALAVSRRRLDTLLLDRAERAGASIERGVTVRGLADGAVRTADGASIASGTVLLATGKHDVRGHPRARIAGDPAVGLRLRLPAHARIGDAIELHLFDRGYAGLVVQEDGSANLCLAVRRSRLADAGSPAALLADLARDGPLADRIGAAPAGAIDAVANVPYGWRARGTEPGLWRLGDQAAVIPSLAGEGMGIALASGRAAAAAILRGASPAAYQTALARRTALPVGLAHLLWRLAERPAIARAAVRVAHPAILAALARATRLS